MSKIAQYLQEHLEGEVTDSLEVRKHFACDGSPLKLTPTVVTFPSDEEDVRKILRFSWQLAERGHKLPVTARGRGSSTSGGAIGSGILMVFGRHLNRLTSLNPRKQYMVSEPGIDTQTLQQTLYTHNLFLAAAPDGRHTLGGLISGNAVGSRSLKYGSFTPAVDRLRVVLASGDVIVTEPLAKQELSRKLGLSNFEGEIYRELDSLLEENAELIEKSHQHLANVGLNSAGYNLLDVRREGRFDLTPLMVGAQGTLGIITEASVRLQPHTPLTTTLMISLGRLSTLSKLLPDILKLNPSVCEFVNRAALEQLSKLNPHLLGDWPERRDAAIHLFVEFDDRKDSAQKHAANVCAKLVVAAGGECAATTDIVEQERWRRLFASDQLAHLYTNGRTAPLAISNTAVDPSRLAGYLEKLENIHKAAGLPSAMWGNAGQGVVRLRPIMELSQLGDRQKLFKLSDGVHKAAIDHHGTIAASGGDGRWLAPKLDAMYGKRLSELMQEVKRIFDPLGILNPGVKFGSSDKDIKMMLSTSAKPVRSYEDL